jgi:choline dehydrogenase-like flavoprotein
VFTIRFTTERYRPSRVISLRTSRNDWKDQMEPKCFVGDYWCFELDEDDFPAGTEFKFILDGTWWMKDDRNTGDRNLKIELKPQPGAVYTYDESQCPFDINRRTEMLVENGQVQQQFFKPVRDETPWDIIVIGSGMGGGIVADEVSDRDKRVLVLEAGSYLFPTHVANLPRQHALGRFSKHVWDLWDEFEVRNYSNKGKSLYQGGQGINLGGRSIFWGGLIPRMTPRELASWPELVRDSLTRQWYAAAENLMNVRPTWKSEFHQRVKRFLADAVPELEFLDAPMAVQATSLGGAGIPAGLFSTADLLMESMLTEGQEVPEIKDRRLFINLNHRVERLETDSGRVTRVITWDHIADEERQFTVSPTTNVVLAAGSIESPMIAMRSILHDPHDLIGKGLTDHPSYYMHFAIPRPEPPTDGSKFWNVVGEEHAAKLLARYRTEQDFASHPYNVVIEIGSDLNQGRFIDNDTFELHQQNKRNQILCEVVFLFNVPLVEQNSVRLGQPPYDRAVITMQPSDCAQAFKGQAEKVKNSIVKALGGRKLDGSQLADQDQLQESKLGAAGHEVGSLRLGTDPTSSVVDENLKFRGYDNLYVCDLSVFPTSPAANPSSTLAALAMRLADHLTR